MFKRRLAPDRFDGIVIAGWESADLRSAWDPIPVGRSGKLAAGIRVTASDVSVEFWVSDVTQMLDGGVNVAEAKDPRPVAFLCRPSAAVRGSLAADSRHDVPEDALVFLVDPLPRPPVATLQSAELTSC